MGFFATTPRLDYIAKPNLSRGYLFRAHTALQKGALLEAGVLLREAIRSQLFTECQWKGCLPEKAGEKTPPWMLLKALRKAGHLTEFGQRCTLEMLQTCNEAAHCKPVTAHVLRDCIIIWHGAIDNDPCGEPKERFENCVRPKEHEPACDHNDDDDDGADWWKAGAV